MKLTFIFLLLGTYTCLLSAQDPGDIGTISPNEQKDSDLSDPDNPMWVQLYGNTKPKTADGFTGDFNATIEEKSRHPKFPYPITLRFCRRWWWIPRCKCFFRYLMWCWPWWRHPMCWCVYYCGWR